MTDPRPLAPLLQWRLGLADAQAEPPAPEEIRDWLWLAAQLEGAPLPQCFPRSGASGPRAPEPPDPERAASPDSHERRPPPPPEPPAVAAPDATLPTPWPVEPTSLAPARERKARLLSDAGLLPDAAAVAEALPLQIRQLPLLPNPGLLLRALRPLLTKRPHPRWRELDEERSAVSSYEKRMAWPVFRPRRVPMVALRLVLDGGVPMAVWEPLARELQRVLASSQAFARVELERLRPDRLPSRQPPLAAEAETSITLILSDTAGPHWWDGSIRPWLELASRHQPMVVLHLLPQRYWEASALQLAQELTLYNREPLAANRRYQRLLAVQDPYAEPTAASAEGFREVQAQTLALPVISLDDHELASWAGLVTGKARASCAGRAWPRPSKEGSWPPGSDGTEPSEADLEALWEVFEQRASPAARELLLSMAASTLLTLPILRLLLASVAPEAFAPEPLAEVLLSGLVLRLPDPPGVPPALERVQFDLPPEVRRLLEPHLEPERRRQVLEAVTGLLERHWDRNHRGPGFRALVLGPKDELERDHPELHHIANVTAARLDQLPGEKFRALAAQLRSDEPPLAPPSPWPAAMVFEVLPFEAAQLVPVPQLEPINCRAAWLVELELRPIQFTTAKLKPDLSFERSAGSTRGFHEPLQRDRLAFAATAERADPLSLSLLQIPAGSFLMGSSPSELERFDAEGPQHKVELETFYMSQTPITQAQWREVAGWQPRDGERWGPDLDPEPSFFQTRSNPKARGWSEGRFSLLEREASSDQRPVDNVSWLEAMEFCSRLSQRTGRHYTLPSEAQWEYACRAGESTPFYFGKTITTELANYHGNFTYADGPNGEYRKQTTPVGMLFPANAWGLYDMHGNVFEWCLDHWHESYEGAPTDGSAWLKPSEYNNKATTKAGNDNDNYNDEGHRLLRGGSWVVHPALPLGSPLRLPPGLPRQHHRFPRLLPPPGPFP